MNAINYSSTRSVTYGVCVHITVSSMRTNTLNFVWNLNFEWNMDCMQHRLFPWLRSPWPSYWYIYVWISYLFNGLFSSAELYKCSRMARFLESGSHKLYQYLGDAEFHVSGVVKRVVKLPRSWIIRHMVIVNKPVSHQCIVVRMLAILSVLAIRKQR